MISLIVLTNESFAQNAVRLNKGDIAPFTGTILTDSKLIELDKAQRSNIVLKQLGIAKDELIVYHKQDARVQRRKLSEARFKGFWANTMYFGLGVILTGFAFKVNEKIGDI